MSLQTRCLRQLMGHAHTADEVAYQLSESVLAVRPRITELLNARLIKDTGFLRQNESGRNAHVWTANACGV